MEHEFPDKRLNKARMKERGEKSSRDGLDTISRTDYPPPSP